ncbi:MAG: glycosyltransferase family 9 protein [Candidatus Krumholzibacteriia bacterium]
MSGGATAATARVRRILVIRRRALGDALVTLPAVLQLAAAFPGARIDLVVDRAYAALLAGLAPELTLLPWPPPADARPRWLARLRAAHYDLALDYLGSPRTAFWTALTGAPLRVGYELRGRGWAYNVRVPRNRDGATPLAAFAGEAFLDPLRALGLAPPPWRAAGAPTAAGAGRTPGAAPRIGLALGATWPAKGWPLAHAAELAALAAASGAVVLLVPGPGEARLAAEFAAAAPTAQVAPPTTLVELAALLGTLDVLVATDCGARHLAAALEVPTVTLFGPTDPRGWNPADPRHVAARTGEPCSPCDLRTCPVAGHPCMTGLTGSLVWDKVQSLLGRPVAGGPPRRKGADA